MLKPIEERGAVRQAKPFVHPIRVWWGDCDPAKIAYTANIPGWALEAIESWWEHFAGVDWYQLNLDRKTATPFVHLKMDFRSPVTPRHILECAVTLKHLGHRSVTLTVTGHQNGILCFEGESVQVFVDAGTIKPRTPPADILASIRAKALEVE